MSQIALPQMNCLPLPRARVRKLFLASWIGILAAFAFVAVHAGENVRFQHWFISGEGYNQDNIGVVDSFAEDPKGFIWLGGEYGLARFDGHRLKIYRSEYENSHSLPRDFVRDICFDLSGRLWIATSGGLVYFDPAIDGFEPFALNEEGTRALSTDVSSLAVDRNNNLIVGTHIGMAIVSADRKHIRRYRNAPNDPNSLSDDYVRDVLVDRHERIWVATSNSGVNQMDENREGFIRFVHRLDDPESIIDNDVTTLAEDVSGNIWAGTRSSGVSRIDKNYKIKHYLHDPSNPNSIGANTIHKVMGDRHNRVWLATDHGGLARYRPETDDFERFAHDDSSSTSLSSDIVRGVFEDSRGDLWVGTFPTGVNFFDSTTAVFSNYRHNANDSKSLSDSAILTFFKDSNGTFWVGTENGLHTFDTQKGDFERVYNNAEGSTFRFGAVLDIIEDRDGSLWMASWSGGLFHYDKNTQKFKNYFVNPKDPGAISSKFVWHLFIDRANDLWIATESGGLDRYNRTTDSFESWRHNPADHDSLVDDDLWTLLEDSRGVFWIGAKNGINIMDRATGKFHRHRDQTTGPLSIKGKRIFALLEDRRGRVWVATQDEGLNIYLPDEDRVLNLSVKDGMPSNELAGLLEDRDGNIWITSTQGIARIDGKTFAIQIFTRDNGLVGNHFNRDAIFQDTDGTIYVGGTEGISAFKPSELKVEREPPRIYLTEVAVLNKPLINNGGKSPLDAPITDAKKIVLHHKDTLVTFEFALLNYRAPSKNQYRYRLLGFDEDWIKTKDSNRATYSNLGAGTYTFQVEGANRDGVWTAEPAQIKVIMMPPPWKTWWAYLTYLALFLAAAYYFWYTQIRRIELSKEKVLNSQLIKIDRIKDAILANTSHKLRTPLHSIIGISESLSNGIAGEMNSTAMDYLKVIVSNGRKLTNLVDDILEYSNLTRGLASLNIRPVDIRLAVEAAFDAVQHLRGKKPIQLLNEVSKDAPLVRADENRVFQILTALLERALNATEAGQVVVSSHEQGNYLEISVTNTGNPLTDAQIENAFEPFDFGEDDATREVASGGLALAICKHLVDVHGGEISIQSNDQAETCITFSLPLEDAPETISVMREQSANTIKMLNAEMRGKKYSVDDLLPMIGNPETYTILVVDDDPVNRLVLTSMLHQIGFQTMQAESGQDALEILAQSQLNVSLVILDVMMPGMSGFETCNRIRAQYGYFDLPVIFLSAKKMHQVTLDGFYVGGNEFMTKPLTRDELIPRVINQLRCVSAKKSPN